MSSKIKEEDQIYDILDLSPNSLMKADFNDTPPPAPTSTEFHGLPERDYPMFETNLSNVSNIPNFNSNVGSGLDSNMDHNMNHNVDTNMDTFGNNLTVNNFYLNPHSPSNQSSHSLYSDYSSNPASPYFDALSSVSNNHVSDVGQVNNNTVYLDTNFDHEIALGGSISSTNLTDLNGHPVIENQRHVFQQGINQNLQNSHTQNQSIHQNPLMKDMGYQQMPVEAPPANYKDFYDSHQLEELNNFGQTPTIVFPKSENDQDQGQVHKTPSLFSNSSHNSSNLNQSGNVTSENLLNPEDQYKRGRRKSLSRTNSKSLSSRSGSYSRSRSRSRSVNSFDDYDDEEEEEDDDDENQPRNVISTREKMLELASPNQISKRTQKHPSAYACHLCDKRFTRPYNLKSHLRTHTDERPFICNICGKAFARQHDRKRHEDLHSGEKKFQCKGNLKDGTPYGCGRRFARADALRRHFQTEAGKECIKLLIEEEERENQQNGRSKAGNSDLLSPSSIPKLAISPPE